MNLASSAPSRARGFTLIEMMTAIVVLAVLLAVAAPNLIGFVRSSKVRGGQSELISSFLLARSEAMKRGVTVTVGATSSTAGNFSAGWTVWIDSDGDGVVDSGETVLRSYPDISNAVVASARNYGTTTAISTVSFASTGFLTTNAVTLKLCGASDTTKGYSINVWPVGLADVSDQATCP